MRSVIVKSQKAIFQGNKRIKHGQYYEANPLTAMQTHRKLLKISTSVPCVPETRIAQCLNGASVTAAKSCHGIALDRRQRWV